MNKWIAALLTMLLLLPLGALAEEEYPIATETMTDSASVEDVEVVTISVQVPKLTAIADEALLEKTNAALAAYPMEIFASFAGMAEQAKADYADFLAQGDPWRAPYSLDVSYRLPFAGPKLLNVLYTCTEYTGGAHPTAAVSSQLFDLTTGAETTVEALVKTGELDAFKAAVAAEILRQIDADNLRETYGLFDEYEETVAAWNPDNLYFNEDGITAYFQLYDIAPYASGIVEFTMAADVVLPYLTETATTLLNG